MRKLWSSIQNIVMLIIIQEISIRPKKSMKRRYFIIGKLWSISLPIRQHLLIWAFAMRDCRIIMRRIGVIRGPKKFCQRITITFLKVIRHLSMTLSINFRNRANNGENQENYQKPRSKSQKILLQDILRKWVSFIWVEICLLLVIRQL